jgi:hypothetical protein
MLSYFISENFPHCQQLFCKPYLVARRAVTALYSSGQILPGISSYSAVQGYARDPAHMMVASFKL